PPLSSAHIHPRDLHSLPTRRSSDLHLARQSLEDHLERLPVDFLGLQVVEVEVRHLVGNDSPAHAEVEAPARELVEHADLFDETEDRKSTRLNSSHQIISYAVFCLKK